jgi:hypothetical protein
MRGSGGGDMAIEAHAPAAAHTTASLAKAALVSAMANAAINAAMAWPTFSAHAAIPLTRDSISSGELAVFGHAVEITLTLAAVGTLITYLTFKSGRPRPPYFPRVFLLTLKHGMFAFGVGTSLAILWQRFVGSVPVGPGEGVAVVGATAAAASWLVTFMTMQELIRE